MIGITTQLKRVLTPGGRRCGYVECRRCGTSLGHHSDACPECGSTDVACYDL